MYLPHPSLFQKWVSLKAVSYFGKCHCVTATRRVTETSKSACARQFVSLRRLHEHRTTSHTCRNLELYATKQQQQLTDNSALVDLLTRYKMGTMVNQLMFAQDNRDRIQAVENSFGPSGKPLYAPNRVLIGEGRLMKMSRRGPQSKVFFLFNDVLVYGSIILNGRWHKKQQIIPLEDSQLEDLEDGVNMRNQWLIRTPRKSFYVAAASYEEKRAWIEHIEDCRSSLLQSGGCRPGSHFANTWIPDQASAVCMRCSDRFTVTQRRHHCRKCGFVVCGACSKKRAVIRHIHPTKWLRVCTMCHSSLSTTTEAPEVSRVNAGSTEEIGSDEGEGDRLSEEDEAEEQVENHHPAKWMNSPMDPWSTYVYFKPEHTQPPSVST